MIPFIRKVQHREIYSDRKIRGCLGWKGMEDGVQRVFFQGDENVLKLIGVMVAQLLTITTKSHCIVQFNWVNCLTCELCLKVTK